MTSGLGSSIRSCVTVRSAVHRAVNSKHKTCKSILYLAVSVCLSVSLSLSIIYLKHLYTFMCVCMYFGNTVTQKRVFHIWCSLELTPFQRVPSPFYPLHSFIPPPPPFIKTNKYVLQFFILNQIPLSTGDLKSIH